MSKDEFDGAMVARGFVQRSGRWYITLSGGREFAWQPLARGYFDQLQEAIAARRKLCGWIGSPGLADRGVQVGGRLASSAFELQGVRYGR